MQKFIALCLVAALVSAVPTDLNDLTGTYSLWRPPMWPNYETCCYLQGANITLSDNILALQSIVMGPCAQYLPGTNGLAHMIIDGDMKDISTSGKVLANLSYFTAAGDHTSDRSYEIVYSVEHSPAPVDILTLTDTMDKNCTFELRNDTLKATAAVSTFFGKFIAKMQKMQDKMDNFFVNTADDFTGKFSLWRPPTWQNFSTCCYIGGANVTYDKSTKEFTHTALVMGTCAAHLPGTNGIVKTTLKSGSFADKAMTFDAKFFSVDNKHIVDLTFSVTTATQLTPAPIDVYIYHNVANGDDASCDFLLRKDTQ